MQKFPIDSHIVTKISFASFSARRAANPQTTSFPSLVFAVPEPKFHADRTILRWDILNRTKKNNNKNSKLNITPNATLYGEIKIAAWPCSLC